MNSFWIGFSQGATGHVARILWFGGTALLAGVSFGKGEIWLGVLALVVAFMYGFLLISPARKQDEQELTEKIIRMLQNDR